MLWIYVGFDSGVTLDITRTELVDLLGMPVSEGAVSDELERTEYYAMWYTIYKVS